MISWRETSQPESEPVTVELAKQHLRVDHDYEDELIEGYITAARQLCESITRRAFYPRTVQLTLDHFPIDLSSTLKPGEWQPHLDVFERFSIKLPRPRCTAVASISYQDTAGNPLTIDPSKYVLDPESEPARIAPARGCTWPYVANYVPGTIKVTYTAGTYGTGDGDTPIPQTVVSAILLIVGDLYWRRASTSEIDVKQLETIDALLDTEKFTVFGYE